MDWMQIRVLTTTQAADMISELLMEAGSEGTMIEDRNDVAANQRPEGRWDILDASLAEKIGDDVKVTGYYAADEKLSDTIASVRAAVERVRAMKLDFPVGKLEVQTESLTGEDWGESWKKYFRPIRLSEHIVVRPGWTEDGAADGDKVIRIDPGMAFGTGAHETTGMCAELIEKYVRPGDTVIDIGTGTGILAMAAAHMGAGRVLATDLDPVAVRVAEENIADNGFADVIEARCGDLLEVVDESGDVVIANIIADVTIGLAAPVRARIKDGGLFICSGIALERREEVRAALLDAGYEITDEPFRTEWAAFAARKR